MIRGLLLATTMTTVLASGTAPDAAAIDSLVAPLLAETPGVAVAIVHGDKVIYAKGHGLASVETREPVSADTLFRIGSTTKMITSAALVGLAVEGKLDLAEPIGKYVKGLDPAIAQVTVHQLLSHTGGLSDRSPVYGQHDDHVMGDTVRGFKSDMRPLQPGEIISYSNAGYWTAGLVLEEITRQPFADAIRERVLEPLGMSRSTLRPMVAMTYPLAQQHEFGPDRKLRVIRPFADAAASWPAGSLFSSARDLARFMIAFLNDGMLDGKQVLPPPVIKQLASRHAAIPGSKSHYGYGLVVSDERGLLTLQHGGARVGFGSLLTMLPQQRVGVAVLSNRSGASLPKLTDQILALLVELKPEPEEPKPSPWKLTAAESEKYAGVYGSGSLSVTLVARNDTLFLKIGSEESPVERAGDRFFASGPIGEFSFIEGADGRVKYLHGGLLTLPRTE